MQRKIRPFLNRIVNKRHTKLLSFVILIIMVLKFAKTFGLDSFIFVFVLNTEFLYCNIQLRAKLCLKYIQFVKI